MAWDPTFVPNLAVWSSADEITGKVEGDSLTGWNDRSGNSRHWGVNSSPKYRATAGPSSKPAVEVGTGGGDGYFTAGAGLLSALPSAADAFLVVKGGGGNTGMWYFSTNGQSGHYRYSGNNDIYENFGSSARINASPPVDLSQWRLYNCSSTSGSQIYRIDGTTRLSGGSGYTMGTGTLGQGNGFNCLDFQFAEIIMFNTVLNSTDRNYVGGYISDKYGLTIAGAVSPRWLTSQSAMVMG